MTSRGGRLPGAAVLALAGALLLPAVPPAEAGIIGKDPVPGVVTARSEQEAKESLEKGLLKAGGRLLLVSPNDYLPGLLLPLRRAGLLKEVLAVLPYDGDLAPGRLDEMKKLLESAGVAEPDRKTFALDNGSVAGRIEGMPVALFTLTGFPRQEDRECLVVLDTAFLPAVYQNEVKTPMVDLAWKLVLTLRDRRVRADTAILFDAVGRPEFPLEQGYLPSLLRDMISAPGTFAATLPEKWRLLKAAEGVRFFSQYAESMALYKEYLAKAPGDASACYKIAQIAIRDLDVDMSLQWLNKAAEADPIYKRGFAETAAYMFRKEMYDAVERVLQAGLSKFPQDPEMASNLAGLYLDRGDALRDAGNPAAASVFFGAAASVEGADPALREKARAMKDALPTPSSR